MPVWHDFTRAWRESGELTVIGIVQEQHSERARLYAQWQELDWPIAWDPLNLTGSKVVPNLWAIDEHGIVRSTRPSRRDFEETFVNAEFSAPASFPRDSVAVTRETKEGVEGAYSKLLWGDATDQAAALRALQDAESPEQLFRLGVAHRLRYDSPDSDPADFVRALELWRRALDARPDQYIWRRRTQQYGPRLDKPYPFYSWIDEARRELVARGEELPPLTARLTASERLDAGQQEGDDDPETSPDPDAKVPAGADWIRVESAVARHTGDADGPARVHLDLRPEGNVHWNNEAGPMLVWIDAPETWKPTERLFELPVPKTVESTETRRIDFELTPPAGATSLRGYALFHACSERDGTCVYLRKDFELEL